MNNIPSELLYTKTHGWIRDEGNGTVTAGVSDYVTNSLGKIIFIDLPQVGSIFSVHEEIAVIESAKTVYDLYAPVSGEIIEVNEAIIDFPELINEDMYVEGWFFLIKINNEIDLDQLMDADTYLEILDDRIDSGYFV